MPVTTSLSDAELDEVSDVSASSTNPVPHEPELVAAQTGKLDRKIPFRGVDFEIVEELPALVLIDLGIGSDPASKPVEKLRALRQFIDHAVVEGQKAVFIDLLLNATPSVKQAELNELIEKIAPLVSGSPT